MMNPFMMMPGQMMGPQPGKDAAGMMFSPAQVQALNAYYAQFPGLAQAQAQAQGQAQGMPQMYSV